VSAGRSDGTTNEVVASPIAFNVSPRTSSREERDLVETYKLGVNAYVQKPVDFEQFRGVVKELGLFWLVINQVSPS
jgi:DNA-binding NarL/FixJ family response regulator